MVEDCEVPKQSLHQLDHFEISLILVVVVVDPFLKENEFFFQQPCVITVSRSTWMTTNIKNGVAIDLFYTGVIDHPGHMFLN